MIRLLGCTLTILTAVSVGSQPVAKPADPPTKDARPGTVAPPPKPYVITLTASPAAAPVPALRYELIARQRERTPGNAALHYQRAYQLRPTWPRNLAESQRQEEMISKWEQASTDQFPAAEVKKFLLGYANAFKALDIAARCNHCDWELDINLTPDGIGTMLPEVQSQRELARFQKLRIEADLVENDFQAASRDLMTGFRQAKDVAEGPTLIRMLVGIALAAVYTGELDRWVGRPNSPNLYWALTTLPHPLIDPRPASIGEGQFVEALFPEIQALEKGPVSPERANMALERAFDTLRQFPNTDEPSGLGTFAGKVGLAAYIALQYPEAKKQLIALGRPAAEVDKMPPAQVVVLRAYGVYRAMYDDWLKCFSLPYPQAVAEQARASERAAKLVKANETDVMIRLFSLTQPAFAKVTSAHARTERRLTGLRVIEAIRMHAAANGGQPPKQLAEITLVPVPDDPNTGKPFEYSADGTTFKLMAPAPAGELPHVANSFQYVITLRGPN